MVSSIQFLCCFFYITTCVRARHLWSEDLPQVSNIVLEKGKPINLGKNYDKVQISGLNGTLYSDSLSQLQTVTELKIHRNQIREIEKGALCSSPALRVLELEFYTNIKLPVFTRDAFDSCDNLEELLLKFDDNDVGNPPLINQDAFGNLPRLQKLALQGYRIPHMTKHFLKISHDSLTALIFSFCHIQRIDSDVFDDFKNLEEVIITHNPEWSRLPTDIFKNLSKLKKLVLRDNNLQGLSWDEFQGLSSLRELNLVDNQISSFDVDKIAKYMPGLEDLQIEINPAPCKQKEAFVSQLKTKLNHSVEVSYKFGFYDSCEED
ncbi:leucine-rich repeat-containing protein 15-like [Asbolus verrucosus]|uniref:Leucine-rich repeat-containing protein 15-like n=1 Tax=Asbolus verrucosus TaxID=1661398 RepID=A0A482VDE7_ASBVE|nr:leucine-rich repeat-containing protein 15-like [Asbolus verrucosus]